MDKKSVISTKRITIVLVLLLVSGMMLIGAISIARYRRDIIAFNKEQVVNIATTVAAAFREPELLREAVDTNTETEYWWEMKGYIDQVKANTGATYIYVMDRNYDENVYYIMSGAVFDVDDFRHIGTTDSIEEFSKEDFSATVEEGKITVNLYDSPHYGGLFVFAYAPIQAPDGEVLGLVGVDMHIDQINQIINHFALTTGIIILIFTALLFLFLYWFIMRSVGNPLAQAEQLRVAHQKLEEAVQNAQRANEAKSDFLANMSHEMRTPLNAIIGLSDLTLENEALDPEVYSNVEKISSAGSALLGTVNDVLDISKVEAGRFELSPVDYDIPSLINDIIAQNTVRIGNKPIRLILDISENLPERLIGDDSQVKKILNNLLSNAVKYTKEGTITLGIACAREGETVRMTAYVKDTGIGIKPENIERLFTSYNQVDTKANRDIEGTGLGLALAKRMTEMMNGTIQVKSEYGKGSIFTIAIDQRYASDAVIGLDTAENLKKNRHSDGIKRHVHKMKRQKLPHAAVLVVDDNMTNLDVAKGLLKPYEMKIDCVTGGIEAIEAIKKARVHYDAIFMDHMMPGMDGIEAMKKIREIESEYAKSIPVIALTANALKGKEQMFLKEGFQAYLSKPMDIHKLDEVIKQWIS